MEEGPVDWLINRLWRSQGAVVPAFFPKLIVKLWPWRMGSEYQDLPELSRLIFSSFSARSWYQMARLLGVVAFPFLASILFGADFLPST